MTNRSGTYMFLYARNILPTTLATFTTVLKSARNMKSHRASSCKNDSVLHMNWRMHSCSRQTLRFPCKQPNSVQRQCAALKRIPVRRWLSVVMYLERFGGVCCLHCQDIGYHAVHRKPQFEIHVSLYIHCACEGLLHML